MPRSSAVLLTALLLGACSDRNPCAPLVYDAVTRACRCPDGMAFDEDTATCVVTLPSAPAIAIDPAVPRTDDALSVRIETESVDPEGREVEYEYEWTRDGDATSIVLASVGPETTSKHETWTVRVTAVTSDGRRSAAATASVEIANTPPSLATVGLDTYRPMIGESLGAIASRAVDADGDPVSVRWSWLRNGAPIEAAAASTLVLGGEIAGADHVRVIATPSDGSDEGVPVTAGPAEVLDRTTRWRALLPSRELDSGPVVAYDAAHRRVLLALFVETGSGAPELWEFGLDDGLRSFVRLFPSGEPPDVLVPAHVHDSVNRRIVVFGGAHAGALTNDAWALDISRRGDESWSRIGELGEAPPPRLAASVGYDPATQRMFVFGGIGSDASVHQDLWSLDLSSSGGGWTLHDVVAPPVYQPTVAYDPHDSRMVVFGGARLDATGYTASDRILTFDPADLSAGFRELPARLPVAVSAPLVARDPTSTGWIVAGGLESYASNRLSRAAWRLDGATLAATPIAATDVPPVLAAGWIAPFDGGLLVHPRHPVIDQFTLFDLYVFEPSTGAWTQLFVQGRDLPVDRASAAFAHDGAALIVGGRSSSAQMLGDIWSFEPRPTLGGGVWRQHTLLPDPLTGRSPGARADALAARLPLQGFVMMGGRDDSGFSDSTLWSMELTSWRERPVSLSGGEPLPGRAAGVIPSVACDDVLIGGGDTEAGVPDQRTLACTTEGCVATVVSMSEPNDRRGAAVATGAPVGATILVGGRATDRAHSDVWVFDDCGTGWRRPASVGGTAPPARWGHTVTFEGGRSPEGAFLVFGGFAVDDRPVDPGVWRLTRTTDDEWSWSEVTVAPGVSPSGRAQHIALWDEPRRRLLVFGGTLGADDSLGDLWELVVVD